MVTTLLVGSQCTDGGRGGDRKRRWHSLRGRGEAGTKKEKEGWEVDGG